MQHWFVWILSARTSKAPHVPVSSTKIHSSMQQSAPKFANSCPVINSLTWIILSNNCMQFHKCSYCHSFHLSGIYGLLRQWMGKITFFYKCEHADLHFKGLITLWALKTSICLSNLNRVSLELWAHILYAWYSARPICVKQTINLHNDSLQRWACNYWRAPWHPGEVYFEKIYVCGRWQLYITEHHFTF